MTKSLDDAAIFDAAYYERFYEDPRTSVTSRAEMNARGRVIAAYATYLGVPVSRILDAGCGIGMLRAPLRRALPKASYTGVEYSEYLCRRYGWTRASVHTYRNARPFDLVICYDVVQYLGDREARRAVANLGRLCRGLLYFSALTLEDWERNCDRSRTDPNVHLRAGDWYRRSLARAFREIGAGFWLRRTAALPLWEMETPGATRARRVAFTSR